MPRIMIKGVIWNKAQDNILKAGVLRYGRNQWERIIQLLPGKTAQQCKDRMEVGLDQNIKECLWTRKEDDKLLHLALLMPGKWQNIASIIRRTAVDCFNRHDFLANRAQKKKEDNANSKRTLNGNIQRISENSFGGNFIYEEGLEVMLSKARAKLATSQAKKAKLMAREKRLEVARRFASVRRYRERVRARLRTSEMFQNSLKLESSSDSKSASCFYYSSTGLVDPLTEIFHDLQRSNEARERFKRTESPANDEQPQSQSTKVLVLREPNIYEELQEIVQLRRHFESTGRIALSERFTQFNDNKNETQTEINEPMTFIKNNNRIISTQS